MESPKTSNQLPKPNFQLPKHWELGRASDVGSWDLTEQFVQMKVMLSELAAVVAGRDLDDARSARGVDADTHRVLDGSAIESVHDDLEHRVRAVRNLARDSVAPAECRAVRVVGRRDHVLVFLRADFAAGAHDSTRKGKHDALDLAHRADRGFGRGERCRLVFRKDQEVAAADRLLHTEGFLDEELALHHRDAPIALTVEHL